MEQNPDVAAATGIRGSTQGLPPLGPPPEGWDGVSDSFSAPRASPHPSPLRALTLRCRWSVQEPITLYSAEPLRSWYW